MSLNQQVKYGFAFGSCSGVPFYKVQLSESNTKLTMRAQGLLWGSHVFKMFSVYGFRYTIPMCHTGVQGRIQRTRGPEVQLGFGHVLYGRLCHTGAKSYEGPVFLGCQSGVIGHVLYG
jgi:hypothetical protein